MVVAPDTYAARLDIDYPERLDRLTSFFRLIWIIPIAIVLNVLSAYASQTVRTVTDDAVTTTTTSGAGIAGALFGATLLMIVFRRRYPRWWFDFAREFTRFSARVGAYLVLLTDRYPSTVEEQSVHLEIDYPDVERGPQPLASVGQMAAGDPALHRALLSGDRRDRGLGRRVVRHPLHRTLSATAVRLHGGCRPVGTSRAGLRVLAGHRPVPAIQAQVIRGGACARPWADRRSG